MLEIVGVRGRVMSTERAKDIRGRAVYRFWESHLLPQRLDIIVGVVKVEESIVILRPKDQRR